MPGALITGNTVTSFKSQTQYEKIISNIVFNEEAIQCNCHLEMQLICLHLRKAFKTHYLAKLYRTAQSIFFSYFKKYKWQLSIKIDKKLVN